MLNTVILTRILSIIIYYEKQCRIILPYNIHVVILNRLSAG